MRRTAFCCSVSVVSGNGRNSPLLMASSSTFKRKLTAKAVCLPSAHKLNKSLKQFHPPENQKLALEHAVGQRRIGTRNPQGFQVYQEPVLAELVHGVVGAARLQSGFTSEIFLVIVADIRTSHVLVLRAGDFLADFLPLNIQ